MSYYCKWVCPHVYDSKGLTWGHASTVARGTCVHDIVLAAGTPAGGGQADTPAGATLQGGHTCSRYGRGRTLGESPIGKAGKMHQQCSVLGTGG